MTRDTMPFQDLERVYDRLAQAIDAVGPEHEALFLARLALVLSHRLGDLDRVNEAIETAQADLLSCSG